MLHIMFTVGLCSSHKFSVNMSCQMMHGHLSYIKNAIPPKKILPHLQSPKLVILHEDLLDLKYVLVTQENLRDLLTNHATLGFVPSWVQNIASPNSDDLNYNINTLLKMEVSPSTLSQLFQSISISPSAIRVFVDQKLETLSRDKLEAAAVLLGQNPDKRLEIVVAVKDKADTIAEQTIRDRLKELIGSEDEFEQSVAGKLKQIGETQDTRHSALMGGLGLSAGYHYHTKNYIFNLRAGLDRVWGRFRQTNTQYANTENNPRLGYGITLGGGVDYKVGAKAAVGVEGGVRISQFVMAKKDDKEQRASCWFTAPYAQLNFTVYPSPNWSISLFSGYLFARTFKIESTQADIDQHTKCKVDGVYGGLRLSRYW